jgi:hypothetical protein
MTAEELAKTRTLLTLAPPMRTGRRQRALDELLPAPGSRAEANLRNAALSASA